MANRPRVAVRVVRADGGPESVIPMRGDVMLCGRNGDLSLADDPFVADTQMRLFFSGNRLAVEDVGGGNGVFARLAPGVEREVASGGEVRLGRQRLVIEPLPVLSPGEDGATAWGSPDSGFRFRMVQLMEGGTRGSAYPLKEGDNFVGRETGDIVFTADPFLSRRHAMIRRSIARKDGRPAAAHDDGAPARDERGLRPRARWDFTLSDLDSSNGTFVSIRNEVALLHGDFIRIGQHLFRVDFA